MAIAGAVSTHCFQGRLFQVIAAVLMVITVWFAVRAFDEAWANFFSYLHFYVLPR
jgi:hypothetical protein